MSTAGYARRARGAILLLLGCVLVGSCSGGEERSGPPPGPYTVNVAGERGTYAGTLDLRTTPGRVVTITMSDFQYSPTVVETVRPSRVRVILVNASSSTEHTFTIDGLIDEVLAPGERREVSLLAPAEAGLAFRCRFHADSGMWGAINDPLPAPESAEG